LAAPYLFNLILEAVIRLALQDSIVEKIGVQLCGRTINNLRFADDINVIAESEDQLLTVQVKKWI